MSESHEHVVDLELGQGEPPAEMKENFGMETIPDEGLGDEADGELVTLDQAVAESDELNKEES
jgi:hypothetical protein